MKVDLLMKMMGEHSPQQEPLPFAAVDACFYKDQARSRSSDGRAKDQGEASISEALELRGKGKSSNSSARAKVKVAPRAESAERDQGSDPERESAGRGPVFAGF